MRARPIPFSALPDETIGEALSYIGTHLRPADEAEIRASIEGDPAELIKASAAASPRAWLLVDRTGAPIGTAGVADSGLPTVGLPWMVGTPGLEAEGLALARGTAEIVEQMHDAFPVLTNFVDARNDLAVDWLLWAGFRLIDADLRHGPEERLFLQFSKSR